MAEASVWHLLHLAVLESEAKLLLNISESLVQCLWDPRPQALVWHGDGKLNLTAISPQKR